MSDLFPEPGDDDVIGLDDDFLADDEEDDELELDDDGDDEPDFGE